MFMSRQRFTAAFLSGAITLLRLASAQAHTSSVDAPQQVRDYGPLLAVITISAVIVTILAWLVLAFRRHTVRLKEQIEERSHAEEAVKESEERFRSLMETVPSVAVQGYSPDGTVHFWNRAAEMFFGYRSEEAVGANLLELIIPGEMQAGVREAIRLMTESGEPIPAGEMLLLRKDGTNVPVLVSHALFKPIGRPVELFCLAINLTGRKRAERQLEETQELFSLFMKHTPVYTFLKEIDGNQSRVILASDNFIDMVGRPAGEMRGRTMYELFPADFARKITEDDLAVFQRGKVIQLDEEYNGRSYTTIKFPIFRQGAPNILAGFTIDITERKQAEDALSEERQRLASIIEGTNVGTWEWNVQTGETKFNERWAEIIGYSLEELSPVSIATWSKFAHPDDLEASNSLLAKHFRGELDYYECETRMRHRDGSWVWVFDRGKVATWTGDGKPGWMFGTHQDITERKRAEEARQGLERKLLHAQKLESLGVLAGGIAHDFNNILMAIIGNADLALLKLAPESPLVTNLRQIEQSASRAADLAKQMLAYSGKGKFVIENLDLNRLLEDMLHMLKVSIARKAVLRLHLTPQLPAVEADATQMRQMITNLVINAAEAMEGEKGGIDIITGCMEWSRCGMPPGWLEENIDEGVYTYLQVADTGCGMDSETLGRIFDPFFSTKFTGRGLGMAAVLGIVRGHKGAIKVDSAPGKGATFTVLLPVACRGEGKSEGRDTGRDVEWQGSGTVLLVDDEETVREIGTEMLKELGFTVVTASNGTEAIEICRSRQDIVLVILDLTMPNMDGEQCFWELQQNRPGMKVIMSSGYNRQDVTQRFVGKGLAGFIQKPYKLFDLKEALRLVI